MRIPVTVGHDLESVAQMNIPSHPEWKTVHKFFCKQHKQERLHSDAGQRILIR